MTTKNITKFIIAVALTLAVTFSTGIVDEYTGVGLTSTAQASCMGGGSTTGSGGGC